MRIVDIIIRDQSVWRRWLFVVSTMRQEMITLGA